MKLGYTGFNAGPLAQPQAIADLLKCAEDAGFESAWTGEHVVVIDPQEPPSPVPPDFPFIDTIAALSFAAGAGGVFCCAARTPGATAKARAAITQRVLWNRINLPAQARRRILYGVGAGCSR